MATISGGGGPSLDQRRDFSGLKDGTHVPGYGGYCPQIKYRVGKTYGQDTHELSETWDHRHSSAPGPPCPGRPPLQNRMPRSSGDNKLTEDMIPGYTGYIPRWPFQFGSTYKNDCDVCIDEHLTNQTRYREKSYDLQRSTKAFPKLRALKFDPEVKHHLDTFRDTHPTRSSLLEDKRGAVEPPIPGYKGYVPRIYTTELGLGCRYNQMTKKGLEAFQAECDNHRATQRAPITINRTPGAVSATASVYNKRLYEQDGMIPKYTGYVPQRRYNFGNTYGDTTRSLEVCAHDQTCYGDYTKTRSNTMYKSLA